MNQLEYQNPKSTQTLREGIQELRSSEVTNNDASQNVAEELLDDIDVHDAIHVLFACPTSLVGEIIAHVWTAFGTTLKLSDMHRVNMHDDHRKVLAKIGHQHLVKMWIWSIPKIIWTLYCAMTMKRRWPADDYISYLEKPLCDIRKEFGIRLQLLPKKRNGKSGAALRNIRTRGDGFTPILPNS